MLRKRQLKRLKKHGKKPIKKQSLKRRQKPQRRLLRKLKPMLQRRRLKPLLTTIRPSLKKLKRLKPWQRRRDSKLRQPNARLPKLLPLPRRLLKTVQLAS